MAGKKSKVSALARTSKNYAEDASVHGVGYIVKEHLPCLDRIVWCGIVCLSLGLACYFVYTAYGTWQDNLVITTLENTAKDVEELEFPAVTVCREGLDMEAVEKVLANDIEKWLDNSSKKLNKRAVSSEPSPEMYMKEKFGTNDSTIILNIVKSMHYDDVTNGIAVNSVMENQIEKILYYCQGSMGPAPPCTDYPGPPGGGGRKKRQSQDETFPMVDIFINPERQDEKKDIIESRTKQITSFFSSSNMTTVYPNLFKLLWYSSLPCIVIPGIQENNIIKKCEWQGREEDCSSLFEMVPTDSGICCAFNKKNVLRESEYSSLVKNMQEENKKVAGKAGIKKDRLRMVKTGKRKGLRMVLDEHSNQATFSTVQNDFYGFKLFVGSPDEFPALKDRSLLVQPGHENFIEAAGYVVKSSSDIKKLDSTARNCYFQDEGNLEFHGQYSYTSCKFECSIIESESLVGCVPWYLPHRNDSKICDPWKSVEFSKALGVANSKTCSKKCLPDCNSVIYSFTQSFAPFRFACFLFPKY